MFVLFIRALIKAWISIIAICIGLHWMSRVAHGAAAPAITVHVTPIGIDAKAEQALIAQVLGSPEAQAKLKGARYHVLQSEFSDADTGNKGVQTFRLHVYDYTHD